MLRMLWLPNAGRSQSTVRQQELGAALVVGVRSATSRVKTGTGQPLLGRDHRLVIPVRPLHEPHPDRRRRSILGPVEQLVQVGFGVPQVRLDRDADVGPVAELGLGRGPRGRCWSVDVLEAVLLHVEVDERTRPLRQRRGSAAAAGRPRGRAFRVDRVELAVERRELDRDVDARDRAAVVAVDGRLLRPGVDLASQARRSDRDTASERGPPRPR